MAPFLSLMLVIFISIYLGWCTPTEAAALSAVLAILFAILYKEFTIKRIIDSAIKTIHSSAMIFFIIISAQIFSSLITKAGISRGMLRWFTGAGLSEVAVFIGIVIIYLVLGCLMDGTSVTYFTLPLLFPLVQSMGYDPIWFGVIVCVLIETGMITPPVGMNLFVLMGITNGRAKFKDVCMGSLPFVGIFLLMVLVLYLFPILATWLPSTM